MRKLLILLAGLTILVMPAANATEGDPHQVLVCKYVGTPGVDETLQTGQNPIVVDEAALEGDGFVGVFPFEFSDAQGKSIAIRFLAEDESPGDPFDIAECPLPDSPTPPPPVVCPPGTDHEGEEVPEGETVETFCDDETSPPPPSEPPPSVVGQPPSEGGTPPGLPVTGISDVPGWVWPAIPVLFAAGLTTLWFFRRRSIGS